MKNIKITNRVLILLSILSLSLVSCSNDEQTIEDEIIIKKIHKIGEELNANLLLDSSISPEKALLINSEEEFRSFVKNIKSQNKLTKEIIRKSVKQLYAKFEGCPDGTYSAVAMSSGFANLNFDVVVNNGKIVSVNGYFTGWTLGAGYHQQAVDFIDDNTATVTGTVDYSLFWNGFGTVYSEKVTYKLVLNC